MSPDLRIVLGDWQALGAWAQSVRRMVFIQEQGIPEADEWDAEDAVALHAVALDADDIPWATGRLLKDPEGARIGRMAVLSAARGRGLGAQILHTLLSAAETRGDVQAVLHAQIQAVDFYARAGFAPRGNVYDEVGIPHQTMVKPLGVPPRS